MATMNYDLPSGSKLSPTLFVSKPSDSIATKDIYSALSGDINSFADLKKLDNPIQDAVKQSISSLSSVAANSLSKINNPLNKLNALKNDLLKDLKGFLNNFNKDGLNQLLSVEDILKDMIEGSNSLAKIVDTIPCMKGSLKGLKLPRWLNLDKHKIKLNRSLCGTNIISGELKLRSAMALVKNVTSGYQREGSSSSHILNTAKNTATLGLALNTMTSTGLKKSWDMIGSMGVSSSDMKNLASIASSSILQYSNSTMLKDISLSEYKNELLKSNPNLFRDFSANYSLSTDVAPGKVSQTYSDYLTAANSIKPDIYSLYGSNKGDIDSSMIMNASSDFKRSMKAFVRESSSKFSFDSDGVLKNNDYIDTNSKMIFMANNFDISSKNRLQNSLKKTFGISI